MHTATPGPFRPSSLRVASPCDQDWNKMAGDDKVRFCTSCRQNVYNVTNLGAQEISALVFAREGRLCVRMVARPDGTMVTRDCKSRLRSLKAKGTLGWLAFLILIVPVALGTHLVVQAAWLWGAGQTKSVAAPPSRPVSKGPSRPIMGAMLVPTIPYAPEAERPLRQ